MTACWRRCQTDSLSSSFQLSAKSRRDTGDPWLQPATSCKDEAQKTHGRTLTADCDSDADVETGFRGVVCLKLYEYLCSFIKKGLCFLFWPAASGNISLSARCGGKASCTQMSTQTLCGFAAFEPPVTVPVSFQAALSRSFQVLSACKTNLPASYRLSLSDRCFIAPKAVWTYWSPFLLFF